jgi:hypothetical protein
MLGVHEVADLQQESRPGQGSRSSVSSMIGNVTKSAFPDVLVERGLLVMSNLPEESVLARGGCGLGHGAKKQKTEVSV